MARETSIEYIKGEKIATFYSGEPKYRVLIHKWDEEYPNEVSIRVEDENGILAHIPVSWFRSPKPRSKKSLTDKQRQAAAERLRQSRKAKEHT